jgi:hypothetical protein
MNLTKKFFTKKSYQLKKIKILIGLPVGKFVGSSQPKPPRVHFKPIVLPT